MQVIFNKYYCREMKIIVVLNWMFLRSLTVGGMKRCAFLSTFLSSRYTVY
jgi:hypothetical protein